jgi:hypothetical protein
MAVSGNATGYPMNGQRLGSEVFDLPGKSLFIRGFGQIRRGKEIAH